MKKYILSAAAACFFPVYGWAVTLEVTIHTGDGELRGGNSAWIGLVDSSGRLLEEKLLSTGHNQGQLSTTKFNFRPVAFSKIRIRHDGNPRHGHPFDTYNNWVLNHITVKQKNNSSGYCVIYNSPPVRGQIRFNSNRHFVDLEKISSECPRGWRTLSGDINGDRQRDVVCHNESSGAKKVIILDGSCVADVWNKPDSRWCSHSGSVLYVGDVNGDRKDDLICKDQGRVWFDYSGNDFFQGTDHFVDTNFCTHQGAKFFVGDINGDGRTDFLCHDSRRIWIDYGPFSGRHDFFTENTLCKSSSVSLGDTNRDGRADLSCYDNGRILYDYADQNGRFDGRLDASGTFD